jgi:hypothetical protein
MRDQDEPEGCSTKADLVEEFCLGVETECQDWRSKVNDEQDDERPLKALVDDRSNNGTIAISRKDFGGLTAGQLCGYLSSMVVSCNPPERCILRDKRSLTFSQRFKLPHPVGIEGAEPPRTIDPSTERDDPLYGEPDADRRVLYLIRLLAR